MRARRSAMKGKGARTLAFLLGVDGLRTINEAVEGDLYRHLSVCKDANYTPHLRVLPKEDDPKYELTELNLYFEALDAKDQLMLADMWRLRAGAGDNEKAYRLALQILMKETNARVDEGLALMRDILNAIQRVDKDSAH